jgi:hypothetical protein
MAMTKKHYVAIAEAVSKSVPCTLSRRALAKELAAIFEADNPRFDYRRFAEACRK